MIDNLPPIKVFAGTKSQYMAKEICRELGCELGKMNIQYFADGEFEVSFEESIRGCEVYLVQSTFPNSDNLMELLLMIDAAKRASAASIIHSRKACSQSSHHSRSGPRHRNGSSRRPDSGIL